MERAIDRLEPFQRAISKAHLAAAGISLESLDKKPLIAIANSWNEVCPGHEPLRQLAGEVKKGILEAGGEPIEFNTIAMCDGIAQGHSGMRYCLPHREIITDSIEAMVIGEGVFDGIVFLGACDKIIPGMLNAAARINLPSIVVTAGPCYSKIKPSESKELRQRFLRGEITERELINGTLDYYTGPGICPFLGTANTMGALCESLGMMLPGGSLIPSSTSMRRFQARESGAVLMKLVEKGIRPSRIMTKDALENTIILLSAIGGSLNALIHLPALAAELGIALEWDDFSEITSKTPVLCGIVPNGDKTVVDLHYAGGIPAVLKELESVLHTEALNVNGLTLGEIVRNAKPGDPSIIHSMENPLAKADGIQVLYGNLAPEGALVKTSAVPEEVKIFEGTARVFNSEEECYEAFHEKKIKTGDAVIVRYEGPKGGPGMKELHRITEIIKSIPRTAVITDGRFSGASGGLSIGYLCPEAAEAGPIALIKDGDKIQVDLYKGTLKAEVTDEEMAKRREEWKPVVKNGEKGLLARYAKLSNSAKLGASFR
ncbi:dihydroxy-acid dehydratase [Anaerocolumna xylanovorans]|uniref:Dihydroxy-acid dehydratase n=1 Tax=Anaerocolumna xylanovorans DSM 12503 TaxID=1121345 RepID=A0A1M7YDP4_9FIRM|nr:dihydroxy-acid dehydratase [Anaerocolumna xylanovorans]SHO50638.1 dihydroxy-acid dehydratase [Anaerocolumna xylanovorans DSM 12503]